MPLRPTGLIVAEGPFAGHGRLSFDDLEWVPGQARDDEALMAPPNLRRRCTAQAVGVHA